MVLRFRNVDMSIAAVGGMGTARCLALPAKGICWSVLLLIEIPWTLCSAGILHSDLKAGNILMKTDGMDRRGYVVKIADFGLRRVAV